jgi:tRNA (guanine37-N1)-methyltransferase
MVLRADVLQKAIQAAKNPKSEIRNPKQTPKSKIQNSKRRIILLTPQGNKFHQADAKRLAKYDELIFVCGRYEGFDERIRQFADEEISVGDYVLMGGELPALIISEAVMRLRRGILGKDESTVAESFSENLLEYPQYTKPEVLEIREKGKEKRIKQLRVPKVLLTGHHKNIEEFRKEESIKRTKKRRPDLLEK